MTIQEAQRHLQSRLKEIYDEREAANITELVMENITAQKKIDRMINKNELLTADQKNIFEKYERELLTHKPVQYVLHEAWFAGMKFYVDENVLIPRPETEELVEWIVGDGGWEMVDGRENVHQMSVTILDVGTGSGSIPIALKKKIPFAKIYACDVSETALSVAKKNAAENGAEVIFFQVDFLDEKKRNELSTFDLIVSNPPYIPLKEKDNMHENVVGHEPHLALFVADEDPLVFYKALADFAKRKLNKGGSLFVEIHEEQASNVMKLFSFKGFSDIEIKKDLQGKERMIKATLLP